MSPTTVGGRRLVPPSNFLMLKRIDHEYHARRLAAIAERP